MYSVDIALPAEFGQDRTMSLPTLGKRAPRSKAIALRLTQNTADQLKKLAEAHNLSQADVVTLLVEREFKDFKSEKKKR